MNYKLIFFLAIFLTYPLSSQSKTEYYQLTHLLRRAIELFEDKKYDEIRKTIRSFNDDREASVYLLYENWDLYGDPEILEILDQIEKIGNFFPGQYNYRTLLMRTIVCSVRMQDSTLEFLINRTKGEDNWWIRFQGDKISKVPGMSEIQDKENERINKMISQGLLSNKIIHDKINEASDKVLSLLSESELLFLKDISISTIVSWLLEKRPYGFPETDEQILIREALTLDELLYIERMYKIKAYFGHEFKQFLIYSFAAVKLWARDYPCSTSREYAISDCIDGFMEYQNKRLSNLPMLPVPERPKGTANE